MKRLMLTVVSMLLLSVPHGSLAASTSEKAAKTFKEIGEGEQATPLSVAQPAAPQAPTVPVTPLAAPPEQASASSGAAALPKTANSAVPTYGASPTTASPAFSGATPSSIPAATGTTPRGGMVGAVDTAGGFGAQVLEKVLRHWLPPANVSGVATASLRIGSNGRLLYCEPVTRSGNQALDDSPCQAALKVGSFGNPPYGMVTEVFVTLATDAAAFRPQPAPEVPALGYAEAIMEKVRPQVEIPKGLKGSYTVELRLQVNPSGGVEELAVTRPSGRADVDNAVMAALLIPGILPPFDEGSPSRTLTLLFTLKSN